MFEHFPIVTTFLIAGNDAGRRGTTQSRCLLHGLQLTGRFLHGDLICRGHDETQTANLRSGVPHARHGYGT